MRNRHEERHHHSDTSEDDMKAKRKGHLRPGCDKIIHSNYFKLLSESAFQSIKTCLKTWIKLMTNGQFYKCHVPAPQVTVQPGDLCRYPIM